MGFKSVKLGEIAKFINGRAYKNTEFKDSGTPIVRIQNLTGRGNIVYSDLRLPEDKYIENDDLIYAWSATFGPYIWKGARSIYHYHIWKIEPLEETDKYYLYYLLKHISNRISSQSTGSIFSHITKGLMESFEVEILPYDRQILVGNILKKIDDKIDLNILINRTLEEMAQALFKSWFVDFDPVKAKMSVLAAGGSAEEAERAAMCAISARDEASLDTLQTEQPEAYAELARIAALFPSAMQSSAFGEIPHSWEFKKLKDICRVLNGRAYKNTEFKDHGTPIVRIQNLSNGGKTVYSDLELPKDKLIDKEDFIYAWSATFGPHIWRGPKSIYHYHIWKMDVNEDIVSRYFLYLSMFRKTEQMKNGATGSIFTHLTKSIMEDQDILIATPELNLVFKKTLETYFHKITALHNEASSLESIRDSLLPKLISGSLSTSDLN
ncbi:restriction endonuclease subunit S [Endozoicomonas acroporae]|uniref:restriction endonuclease subunit S n=1 Tax=Endozoicomonas acroporae TaxID=1701104 RepID=UPI000C778A9C|nr:restriction endonuclease subunit S [Endozoicomonas acroporae]